LLIVRKFRNDSFIITIFELLIKKSSSLGQKKLTCIFCENINLWRKTMWFLLHICVFFSWKLKAKIYFVRNMHGPIVIFVEVIRIELW